MISVLMSVYQKENPEWFARAVRSITMDQTRPPEELVLVADGQLTPALEEKISECEKYLLNSSTVLRVVRLRENRQLGRALRIGMRHCRGELVARMDTDDIAVPERLRLQETYLLDHPGIAACGGAIAEFETEGKILRVKHMPESPEEVRSYGKFRNPLNHMTVMFRKDAVERAGGYMHFPLLEDYNLWSRMLAGGEKIANLPEVLAEARIGDDFAEKRGGLEYFLRYKKLRKLQRKWGILTLPEYIESLILTFAMTMQPKGMRKTVYRVLRGN